MKSLEKGLGMSRQAGRRAERPRKLNTRRTKPRPQAPPVSTELFNRKGLLLILCLGELSLPGSCKGLAWFPASPHPNKQLREARD